MLPKIANMYSEFIDTPLNIENMQAKFDNMLGKFAKSHVRFAKSFSEFADVKLKLAAMRSKFIDRLVKFTKLFVKFAEVLPKIQ